MSGEHVKLSDQVRQAIKTTGLRASAVAKEVGVTPAMVSAFLLGKRGLSMKVLDRIADLMDMHVTVHGKRLSRRAAAAKSAAHAKPTTPDAHAEQADPQAP